MPVRSAGACNAQINCAVRVCQSKPEACCEAGESDEQAAIQAGIVCAMSTTHKAEDTRVQKCSRRVDILRAFIALSHPACLHQASDRVFVRPRFNGHRMSSCFAHTPHFLTQEHISYALTILTLGQ
eukprot:366301-Chlamydomonas_euryale.AAC.16